MKQNRLIALVLLFWITGYSQPVITAEDAIKIGLEYNYDIRIARNNLEIARNTSGLGTAGFLPTVSASAGESVTRSEEDSNNQQSLGDTDSRQRFAQVSLDWALFDGFRMFVNKNRFDDLETLGEYQTRNLIENTSVAILRAYFNLVQQEKLLTVVQDAVSISATRLEKEEVRQELGSASSTDLLNARVSYNNDREQLINREISVVAARKDLNILLGRKPEAELRVQKEIVVEPLSASLEDLLEASLERNSALLASRQNKRVSDQEVRLAASAFYPTIFLNGSYGYRERTTSSINDIFTDIETDGTDAVVGVTLSFNLFNGFRDRIDWQNARIEAKNQALYTEDLEQRIRGLMQVRYETFLKRQELIELEVENVASAEQNLELQQDRYELGTTSSLEFRDAQLNFTRAQTTLIEARFQARISRLEIEQLAGILNTEN